MSVIPRVFEVFFTGIEDPRDGYVIIGEDTKPIFFRFETPEPFMRTTVYRNAGEVVAWLDWADGYGLGLVTIASRPSSLPMSSFVMQAQTTGSRMFYLPDERRFEWRRCEDDPHSYNLYNPPHPQRIATYRRCEQATPVGPSYAFMSYLFDDDTLMLEALVALCINKWIDWPQLAYAKSIIE